jgi:hypothetical protein
MHGSHLRHFAPLLFIRRQSPLGPPLTLLWPLGHTCCGASGLPRSSQGHPRAWLVLVVLAASSYPDDQNRLARSFLPYVAYVCFKLFRGFRCMLQLFHLDVAKVDRRMLHILHTLQVF